MISRYMPTGKPSSKIPKNGISIAQIFIAQSTPPYHTGGVMCTIPHQI
jgi:hypothetical protein